MCGLAGFQGLALTEQSRALLVWALGEGTDRRGGHAVGFVSTDANKNVSAHRRLGRWGDKDATKFIMSAARGVSTMLHARFATCGTRGVNDAHPFTIKRADKTILHGMHNGMIYNARESARDNNRDYSVDSRELFELLADDDVKAIEELDGYGVITWVAASDPDTVFLCKISEDGELYVASVKGGGVVWGSTKAIVQYALATVGLEVELEYEIEHGIVHSASNGSMWIHRERTVKVAERPRYQYGFSASFLRDNDRARTSGGGSLGADPWASWRDDEDEFFSLKDRQKDSELSDDEIELIWEEDDARKQELCDLWSIDPAEVEDLTYDELDDYINGLFRKSEETSTSRSIASVLLKEGKDGDV